ncbi:MAG: DUF748 domain-containing protein [Hydrogenovibrio sp.]
MAVLVYSRWQQLRKRYKALVVLLVLLGGFLILLPTLVKTGLKQALLDQGAESVSIERVSVNLFTGRAEIDNLTISAGSSSDAPADLHLGRFKINFSWRALFEKNLFLQELELYDTVIEVNYQPGEMLRVAGLPFPLKPAPQSTEEAQAPSEPFGWGLGIEALWISDLVIKVQTPQLNKRFDIDRVRLRKALDWEPNQMSTLSFRIEDERNLWLGNFQVWPFDETQRLTGNIDVINLDLTAYQPYLPPEISHLSGLLSAKLQLNVDHKAGMIRMGQKGRIDLSEFSVAHLAQTVTGQAFQWTGEMTLALETDQTELKTDGQWGLKGLAFTDAQQQLRFADLQWQEKSDLVLSGGQPKVTSQSDITLKNLAWRDSETEVRNQQLRWQGQVDFSQTQTGTGADAVTQMQVSLPKNQFTLTEFHFQAKQQQAQSQSLDWSGAVTVGYQSGAQNRLTLGLDQNRLQLAALHLQAEEVQADLNALNWFGQVQLSQGGQTPLSLTLPENQLTLETLNLSHPQGQAQLAALDWSGQVDLSQVPAAVDSAQAEDANAQTTLGLPDTKLMLSDLALQAEGTQLNLKGLAWQGKIDLVQAAAIQANSQGNWVLTDLAVTHRDLVAQLAALDWSGHTHARLNEGDTPPQMDAKGDLTLTAAGLANSREKLQVAKLQQLQTQLQFTAPQTLGLTDLSLNQLVLAEALDSSVTPLLQLNRLDLDKADVTEDSAVSLGKLALEDMKLVLQLDAEDRLIQVDQMLAALQPEAITTESNKGEAASAEKQAQTSETSETSETSKTPTPALALQQLKIVGDSHVRILSNQTQPPINQDLVIQTWEIGALDTQQPKQKTPVTIEGQLNKYSTVALKGTVQPFTPKVNTQMALNIKNMDLYGFSALIRDALGYRIQSGSMNLQSEIDIQDDILNSTNKMKLSGFEMLTDSKPVKGSDQDGKGSSLNSMSLALDLLRDSQNNIELDVPVKGDLSDPGFNPSQVIQVALMNALKGGTKAMLAMTLQPYGAIYLAAEYAYKKVGEVTLQPVEYQPGLVEWREDMPSYLKKIGHLLNEKSSIQLKVCGFYNASDEEYWVKKGLKDPALKEKLYHLARDRQDQVKGWLVEQAGIDSGRLTTCYPGFEDLPVSGVTLSM